YDGMGRPWRTWKPYSRTSATYDPNFANNAPSEYGAYLGQSNAKPYRETQYTADALSRVKREIPEYVGSSPRDTVKYAYGIDTTAKQAYTEVTDESGKK